MKLLVIYELVSESVYTAVVEVTEADYEQLKICDGLMVNVDDMTEEQIEANTAINNALADDMRYADDPELTEFEKKFYAQWSGKELTNENCKGIERVIKTGFYL